MEPVPVGAKFFYGTNFGGPYAVIKPADNVAGIVIRTGVFSGSYRSIVATGTTISNYINEVRQVLLAMTAGGVPHQFQYPIYLPPGFGLWTFSNDSGPVMANITYDIL